MGCGFGGQRDAFARRDHVHQRIPADIATAEMWNTLPLGKAADDMIPQLRTSAALSNEEGFRRKV